MVKLMMLTNSHHILPDYDLWAMAMSAAEAKANSML
jgi:hypothetical protein